MRKMKVALTHGKDTRHSRAAQRFSTISVCAGAGGAPRATLDRVPTPPPLDPLRSRSRYGGHESTFPHVLAICAVSVAALGGQIAAASGAGAKTVTLRNLAFSPKKLSVSRGTTVPFAGVTARRHTTSPVRAHGASSRSPTGPRAPSPGRSREPASTATRAPFIPG